MKKKVTDLMILHDVLNQEKNEKQEKYKIKQATIAIKESLFKYLTKYRNFLITFGTSVTKLSGESFLFLRYGTEGKELEDTLENMRIYQKNCKDINDLQEKFKNSIKRYDNIINEQIDFGNDFKNYCNILKQIKNHNVYIVQALKELRDYEKKNGSNHFTEIAKEAIIKVTETYYDNNEYINNEISPRIKIPRNKTIPRLHEIKKNKK